jgi:hypothetical protein
MAIWRDPLDDLTADLDQAVPATTAPICAIPPMEDHIVFMEHLRSRDPAEKARLAEDPRVKRVQLWFDSLARVPRAPDPVEPRG